MIVVTPVKRHPYCNACKKSKDFKEPVYEVGFFPLSFRLCEKCRKSLILELQKAAKEAGVKQ